MEAAYREAFAALADGLIGFEGQRKAAIQGLSFPRRHNEAWRFTPVRRLLAEVLPVQADSAPVVEGVLPIAEVLRHLAISALGTIAPVDGFAALNLAMFSGGGLIFVPAGEVADPITVRLDGAGGMQLPRLLVVAEAGSTVEILVEHHVSGGLSAPVIEIDARAGATVSLTHTVVGPAGDVAATIAARLGEDSTVSVQSLVQGGGITRIDIEAWLGANSALHTSGLVLARARQHSEHHLLIHHAGSGAVSTQTFRNIVDERARAVFTGLVVVDKDVHQTDANQSANTLLLSDQASVMVRPWLEINNDEVKAAHGATVGRLDPEALFYLRARGIGVEAARSLLTGAFAGEFVQTVPERFRASIDTTVSQWLEAR